MIAVFYYGFEIVRSVGVPAKGCKRDLVYALKCFVDKKMDGKPICSVPSFDN